MCKSRYVHCCLSLRIDNRPLLSILKDRQQVIMAILNCFSRVLGLTREVAVLFALLPFLYEYLSNSINYINIFFDIRKLYF